MLHVQETVNLLMQTPMNVMVQPQPSSSSRSIKVIEQLTDKHESILKDIAATKAQLDIVRQTKLQKEKETVNYTNSNKQLRVRITEIMQVLESKQKLLDGTKGSSVQLEQKVKQLKEKALASRRQLEDLRRREQVLEHDRDVAVKEKNQKKHQKDLLYESIEHLRLQCEKDMSSLQSDLDALTAQSHYITDRNECMMELVHLRLKQRRQQVEQVMLLKRQNKSNTEVFIDHVRKELQELKTVVQQSTCKTNECTQAAIQCRSEVNGLVSKIKSIAAEITASQ